MWKKSTFWLALTLVVYFPAPLRAEPSESNPPATSNSDSGLTAIIRNWITIHRRTVDGTGPDSNGGDGSGQNSSIGNVSPPSSSAASSLLNKLNALSQGKRSGKNSGGSSRIVTNDNAPKNETTQPGAIGDNGGQKPPDSANAGNKTGDSAPPGNGAQPTPYWMPICWIIDPSMPSEQVNSLVKGVVDGWGKCGISVEPYVFRVKYVPPDPDTINSLAKQVCPLNKVFGVAGSAVQTTSPSDRSADQMCGNFPKPPDVTGTEVAGCAELGNGASGGGGNVNGLTGSLGKAGQKGVPAANILDREAWGSPPVACHELGHNVGGPGRGGDFLVNVGDGKRPPEPQQAGMGLEAQGGGASACYEQGQVYYAGGMEGTGLGDSCDFTDFGCRSLQGGANPNDGRHMWDPTRNAYFFEDPSVPPQYDLMAGKSFFDPPPPPKDPPMPPVTQNPPQEQLVFNEQAGKNSDPGSTPLGDGGTPPDPGVGHKVKNGSNSLLNNVGNPRKKEKNPVVPPKVPDQTVMNPNSATASGGGSGSSYAFDENASKNDDSGATTNSFSGNNADSSSSSNLSTVPNSSPDTGAIGSSFGLGFDENAAKGGATVGSAGGTGVGAGAAGSSSSDRSPASTAGKTDSGYQFDEDFWKTVGQIEQKKKRVKGSTLRGGPAVLNSQPVGKSIYQTNSSSSQDDSPSQ